MPIVAADWSVTQATKKVAYIGDDHGGASPTYATGIELHRWLQLKAWEETAVGDDELDITKLDPSRRATDQYITFINGYTIDETTQTNEHIYDASIVQNDGDDIWDAFRNFGNADVQIQIIQNGAVLTDDWWNFGGGGLNPDATRGISHRFILKTRTGGTDIDGRRLIGICRTFLRTFKESLVNGTERGANVLSLSDALDLNNTTIAATVATWTGITNVTEGYVGLDVDNNTTDEFYYSQWNRDVYSINQFWERMKWLTRDGTAETIYGISGELFRGITHEIDVDGQGGTDFSAFEPVSWTGGTGQMFAVDDVNAASKMWIQLLNGVPPTDGQTITGGTSGATCDVDTTVTDRSALVSTPFIGQSTGSALIGAYGVGLEVGDLTAADKLIDLGGNTISPPNFVQNTVAGLVSGEDQVLVGPWDGSTLDPNGDPALETGQFLLSTALTADNITAVVIKAGSEGSAVVPSDTPNTGYIRVIDDNGFDRRLHYSSWSGSTFVIDSTDGQEDFGTVGAAINNEVYISYIDGQAPGTSMSFTSVQSGTRDLVALARDGGVTPIVQFISSWSQTSSPQTISIIRNTDL